MEGTIHTVSRCSYSFVVGDDKAVYFLHHSNVIEGEDLIAVGQRVIFDVAPPLPTKRYANAVNAVVGSATSNDGGSR